MFDAQTVRWIVWSGLVALTLSLLVLMRTRWGQSHPLRKCIVLSLVAHLLLGIYTTTVNIVAGGRGPNSSGPLRVAFIASDVDGLTNADVASDADAAPAQSWEVLGTSPVAELSARIHSTTSPTVTEPPAAEPAPSRSEPASRLPDEIAGQTATATASERKTASGGAARQPRSRLLRRRGRRPRPLRPSGRRPPRQRLQQSLMASPCAALPTNSTEAFEAIATVPLLARQPGNDRSGTGPAAPAASEPLETVTRPATTDGGTGPSGPTTAPAAPPVAGDPAAHPLPQIYELRMEPDRLRAAIGHGGTRETEAAVRAALAWLSTNQNADGRWNGRRLEAGRGTVIDGQDRRDAGTQADTGLTGLSLLAFLASGHTHLEGDHREQVRHGIDFLMSVQAADGNLGGKARCMKRCIATPWRHSP